MSDRTITITIPEVLYLHLEAAARSSAQSVDALVAQSLERTIPPHLAAQLPPALRSELDAMEQLSDEALRAIAYSVAPAGRATEIDELIADNQAGTLSPPQQERLLALRAAEEALMVRKAHAFVLLKSRGHAPPPVDHLPMPSA